MALFKILKGTEAKLPTNKVEGYCYVTTDTKKMYVDTGASTRICLNAANADIATKLAEAKTIEITGAVTGLVKFDGSADVNIATEKNHTHLASEITDLDTYSFITTDDIDAICGQSIVAASEVTF